MAHASQCDACGALLHAVIEDFSAERTAAESQILESLESARPEWQRTMARRMAEASRFVAPRPVSIWLAAAAAVVLAVMAGWWSYDHWFLRQPARLIAQAYTEQRPFEFRIAGAGYGPVRMQRRAVGSFQRPAAMLEAEARIARELEKSPDNAEWLALRARAEMLAWDAETAIATLTRAFERRPDDPALLADLGAAYALRAEAENRAIDYGMAIEYLTRSIRARPQSPEVVFNRAVVYERMFLYEDAMREWQQYLKLDAQGGWADEARRRLGELEQKKKPGRQD